MDSATNYSDWEKQVAHTGICDSSLFRFFSWFQCSGIRDRPGPIHQNRHFHTTEKHPPHITLVRITKYCASEWESVAAELAPGEDEVGITGLRPLPITECDVSR